MKPKRILSVSRRTDIPAFYTPWLINRLNEGFCDVLNPFNNRVSRVSLLPEDVVGMVFWTRNPAPILKYLKNLESMGFSYYFQFTLTGYGTPLESFTPPPESAVRIFKKLSEKVSSSRVIWRYDPIIVSSITPVEFHLANFERAASALSGYTDLAIISFVDLYRKSARSLNSLKQSCGLSLSDLDERDMVSLASGLKDIALDRKIELRVCCENNLLAAGFDRASCVDPSLFQDYGGGIAANPTREGCGCFHSIDIGIYSTCLHGCNYCYATVSQKAALKNFERADMEDSLLIRPEKYND